eukprot:2259469-Amphidinium_carterae.1
MAGGPPLDVAHADAAAHIDANPHRVLLHIHKMSVRNLGILIDDQLKATFKLTLFCQTRDEIAAAMLIAALGRESGCIGSFDLGARVYGVPASVANRHWHLLSSLLEYPRVVGAVHVFIPRDVNIHDLVPGECLWSTAGPAAIRNATWITTL